MGLGTGELVVIGVLLLMCLWFVVPVVGIIRANRRRTRGAHSAAAPILAGVCLGLLLCVWLLGSLSRHAWSMSRFSYLELALHILWLVFAIQANQAARRKAV